MNDLSSEAKLLLRRAREEFSPGEGRLDAVRASLATRTAAGDATSSNAANSGGVNGARGVNAVRAAGWTTAHTAGAAFVAGAIAASIYAFLPRGETGRAATAVHGAAHVAAPPLPALVPEGTPVAQVATSTDDFHRPSVNPSSAPIVDAERQRANELRAAPPSLRSAARFRGHVESPPEAPAPVVNAGPPAPPINVAPAPSNAAPPALPAKMDDSLSDEVRLLREARGALDRGDPARALTSLDLHEARFPRGTLYEERLATRVQTFCALGRIDAARSVAQELERAAPRSPHLLRVRASCVASPPPK